MRFSLLGPLRVAAEDGTEVEVRGTLRRTLLAELLLNAGSVVSASRLAELLWATDEPGARGARLHNQVARLRQDLGGGTDAGRIKAAPPGYLIEVSADELDLRRFTAHSAAGRQAAGQGDWTTASAEYNAALALWRGAPLADLPALAGDPVVQRLDEERWSALRGRIEADLNLGRHTEAVAELRALIQDQPLREPLHAQLMLALHQDGRRTEALEVFRALSRRLADEAGLEPGAAARELHERILREDPTLRPPGKAPARPDPVARASARNQLPVDTRLFTGRERETERLLALAREAADGGRGGTVTISAVDGLGGVGKSALAVRIAHRVADRFPDGQLFLDLRGNARDREPLTPLAALGQLLRSLDVPQRQIPADLTAGSALLHERLRGTRTLILLDNAAAGAQVRPLLPDVPGCLVLITSRARLLGIEGAHTLRLDVLTEAEATALLLTASGPGRLRREDPAVAELAELCGRIPLALRIVAARLRHRGSLTAADLVAQLRDEHSRLGGLRDEDRDLADVLGTSYTDLAENERRAFRLLGLVPGTDVDTYAAAALLDLDLRGTERLLDLLLDHNLLMESATGRYRMHDLVRLYAAGRAASTEHEAEREEAVERLLSWYAESTQTAWQKVDPHRTPERPAAQIGQVGPLAFTDSEHALGWYDREAGNLLAAAGLARTLDRPAIGLKLANGLLNFLFIRGNPVNQLEQAEFGLRCAQALGDLEAQSRMSRRKGVSLFHQGLHDEAIEANAAAAALARSAGFPRPEADAMVSLSAAAAAAGRVDESIAAGQRAVALFEGLGLPRRAVGPLINMSAALNLADRNAEAIPLVEQAVRLSRESGDPVDLAMSLAQLAEVMHAEKEYDREALGALYPEALEAMRAIGNRRYEVSVLINFGVFLEETGRPQECVKALEEAERLSKEVGTPFDDKARDTLSRARAALSATSDAAASSDSDS